jgi:hypothetical protein
MDGVNWTKTYAMQPLQWADSASVQEKDTYIEYSRFLDIWKSIQKAIGVVEKDPIINKDTLQEIVNNHDFEDQYAHAHEDIDERFPKPKGEELLVSIFFDSDHAHDRVTGRSISGVIVMVGWTPITWKSRRQVAIAMST